MWPRNRRTLRAVVQFRMASKILENVSDSSISKANDRKPELQSTLAVWTWYQRSMQKLAVSYIMFNIVGPFWWWPFSIAVLATNPLPLSRWFLTAYMVHIFITGRQAHMKSGGPAPIRRLRFWKHLADYFPAKLVKTVDLDPKEHYLFCGHPHGIACFSYTANFFIEATGFSEMFPGINLHPVLLEQHFFTPIHREICLLSGFRGNSKEALLSLLQGPPGSSVFLIPGGAPEALKAQPGTNDLIINRRKGFINIALQTGAHLVPVVGFGETDLFNVSQPTPGSISHKLQQIVLRLTGFAFPAISGSGFWSGGGPLPKSKPLHTIVGRPLKVTKWEGSISDPAFKMAVNELHTRYLDAIRVLYDEHKEEVMPMRRKSLDFVE